MIAGEWQPIGRVAAEARLDGLKVAICIQIDEFYDGLYI